MATPGPTVSRLETGDIIRQVAKRLVLPEETVLAVYKSMIEVMEEGFLREEKVVLRGFGVMRGRKIRAAGVTTYAIRFKPSNEMRSKLKRKILPMEKYGVELNNEAVLLAKVTGKCPVCKSDLEKKDPPNCNSCGTTPFERKKKDPRNNMARNFGTPNKEEE